MIIYLIVLSPIIVLILAIIGCLVSPDFNKSFTYTLWHGDKGMDYFYKEKEIEALREIARKKYNHDDF